MLPESGIFAQKMGDLGISEGDHVVIYDSSGFGPACRVFWTFKVFGHNRVSVLNGGLVKWMLEKRPIVSGAIEDFAVFIKC
jgi:thiosulfate/3-mercaptopyruvate sulfurtransferase